MRILHIVLMLVAILTSPVIFAQDQDTSSSSKPCETIVNTCLKAGYLRTETPNKQFWLDCMKPLILGKTVQDVTVDSATIKACRTDKINDLKLELKEFQKASDMKSG